MKNRKNYSNNWHDQIRPFILKRDNYQCKKCKVHHRSVGYYEHKGNFVECDEHMKEWASKAKFKLQTIYLQVHHKNGNTLDNANENLITLCPKCHLHEEKDLNKLKKITRGIIYPPKK